jgi:hypothetical protein
MVGLEASMSPQSYVHRSHVELNLLGMTACAPMVQNDYVRWK